jgi:hypothetical protein
MFWQNKNEAVVDGPRIDELREELKANRIHFPTPVPIFPTQFRPDIQWRLVELYFVRGWSSKQLAERYGVTARRIQQSLQNWAGRAMALGYLQAIPADTGPVLLPAPVWAAATLPATAPPAAAFLPIAAAPAQTLAASPQG